VPEDRRNTVAGFLDSSPAERARDRQEIEDAEPDDPYIEHDRAALAWTERLVGWETTDDAA
jgi:hypothetical protein